MLVMSADARTCTKCGQVKEAAEFYKDARRASGLRASCKVCCLAQCRQNFERTKEARVVSINAWKAANKPRIAENARNRYAADPEKQRARAAAYNANNRDERRAATKKYWESLSKSEKSLILSKKYQKAKDRVSFRLRDSVSRSVRRCLVSGKGGKSIATLLDFSIQDLKTHLERQFLRGMSWSNYGDWHIDHIVPLSSFTITGPDDPELRRAWALPNLRPLWAKDNQAKHAEIQHLL